VAPENLTTFAHFSVSSAMSCPNAAGEPGSRVPPRSPNRAFSFGSASPALTALLRVSTMAGGVPLGAPLSYQELA
jgi:hypothetical protein